MCLHATSESSACDWMWGCVVLEFVVVEFVVVDVQVDKEQRQDSKCRCCEFSCRRQSFLLPKVLAQGRKVQP
jgi:hypothetical protein